MTDQATREPTRDRALAIAEAIRWHATHSIAKPWQELSARERWTAVALTVRDEMAERMLETEERYRRSDPKRLHYLSLEFLIGRPLGLCLHNLRSREAYEAALGKLGSSLGEVEETDVDVALGNGGLGRLAACFLDSLATLGMPACGYGINYEYGLFRQEIEDGYQREKPENWLSGGTPWEIARPDEACLVPIYGRIEHGVDRGGGYNPMWMDWRALVGVPHDILIPGDGGRTVSFLRLFSARASRDFDIRIFNDGDYVRAVEQKIQSESVSKVLYPSDAAAAGRELRLVQEYFLVACSVRDIVRRFERDHRDVRELSSKTAIQLNDTHPSLAIVELMRLLVDERDLSWDEAWQITQATIGYTNHTLAAEALEKWPVPLLERVLPRHLQIIFEINRRLLDSVAIGYPRDPDRPSRISLIEESDPKQVRMAHLAVVGSHSVNGVSAIHSTLLRTRLLGQFAELWPERFHNVTNGISPRAWLLNANPPLAQLVTATIGDAWITNLDALRALEPSALDAGFRAAFRRAKRSNKERLARVIREGSAVAVDLESMFDVQVKRIHAYKRQILNVMHIVFEYLLLIEDGRAPIVPRTYVFAGKAAPGYALAKSIIKLIHNVARVIDDDARAREWIKVVFIPDYKVSLAEKIIPAGDLSEQISTAGTEASGTGNMKLALSGAIMIGTRDGANLEIRQDVGAENMFTFGLTTEEVEAAHIRRSYRPREIYDRDASVRRIVDALRGNLFCRKEPELFAWLGHLLLDDGDEHVHLADVSGYLDAHARAAEAFRDRDRWDRMAIQNVARSGRFSSDRSVGEYAREIWGLTAC